MQVLGQKRELFEIIRRWDYQVHEGLKAAWMVPGISGGQSGTGMYLCRRTLSGEYSAGTAGKVFSKIFSVKGRIEHVVFQSFAGG